VAARFAANPYVVGYDPINEPFPANIYKNPELWYQVGTFDASVLQPLYSRIYEEAYAPASDSKIMFFEPAQFPDTVFHTGFTALPAGSDKTQLHIFNDHSYSPCALSDKSDAALEEICKDYHLYRILTRDQDAKKLGIPLIISEFGACMGGHTCEVEINTLTDAADTFLTSWAYWQFKKLGDLTTTAGSGSEGFYNDDGTLQVDKVTALSRPYAQYTQGTLMSMNFNRSAETFSFSFIADTSIAQPTVVYYSK
jgi:aryl-phospho-beta-D-glucosidase BglC (GH1 family)